MMPASKTYILGERRTGNLTLSSVVQEFHDYFAETIGQRKANAVIRYALAEAGKMWIAVFLPKRFKMDYATRYLSYHASPSYNKYKEAVAGKSGFARDVIEFAIRDSGPSHHSVEAPQPTPFVYSGDSRRSALADAYPVAFVTASKATLKIKLNIGAIKFKNASKFTFVPKHEYIAVVQHVERTLRLEIQNDIHTDTLSDMTAAYTNPRNAQDFRDRSSGGFEERTA